MRKLASWVEEGACGLLINTVQYLNGSTVQYLNGSFFFFFLRAGLESETKWS